MQLRVRKPPDANASNFNLADCRSANRESPRLAPCFSKRAKYGRYTNEKHLVRVLGYTYVLLEVLGWSSAAALGKQRSEKLVAAVAHRVVSIHMIDVRRPLYCRHTAVPSFGTL